MTVRDTALHQLPVSFQSLGEATGLPVQIVKADFTVIPVAAIKKSLVKLNLAVVNDQFPQNISAKLKITLPHSATVCRFQFQRDGKWYPATPVESVKAEAVVYKEREKGRSVAAVKQAQGSVFQIEVFPLVYKHLTHCELWYSDVEASLPFQFDPHTQVYVNGEPFASWSPPQLETTDSTSACVGACFGEKHFACYLPFVSAGESRILRRIAIVWDTSASQNHEHHLRFERLRDLALHSPGVVFDVWTFGVSFCKVADSLSVEETIAKLQAFKYDGGTDLTLLPQLVADIDVVDAALLFSDGMDNLKRWPTIQTSFPIHCIVDQFQVDVGALRSLCHASGGHLLKGNYLQILEPQTMLTRIVTDQDDADFCSMEDGFKCCPDHRLHVHRPIGQEGLWICGTVGGVQKLKAEVLMGGRTQEFHFDLSKAPDIGCDGAVLLGFLYASQQYAAVERDGALMGLDLAKIRAELALHYGFCSPEASLLMLYEPEQFAENQIQCPVGHPAYDAWVNTQGNTPDKNPDSPRGDPGQRKTETQMQQVMSLAQSLKEYHKNPIPPPAVDLLSTFAAGGGEGQVMAARAVVGRSRAATSMWRGRHHAQSGDMDRESVQRLQRRCRGASISCGRESDDIDLDCNDDSSAPASGCASSRSVDSNVSFLQQTTVNSALDDALHDFDDTSVGGGDLMDMMLPLAGSSVGGGRKRKRKGGQVQGNTSDVHVDFEAYVQGKEQSYLPRLEAAVKDGTWREVYDDLRKDHASSPSFFLYSAGLILECSAKDAVRVCSNCLEINIQDVAMMRSTGYFLLKAGRADLAIAVFDQVSKLAPTEPQSFLDGALSRFLQLQTHFEEKVFQEAMDLTTTVITHAWASRFKEIEWPALVLLHMLAKAGERQGLKNSWPVEPSLRCENFEVGLLVWLGWDTDHTDLDLHVVEPSGNEVYYSNTRSAIGGHLSRDFTDGYGPECYLLKDPVAGEYKVRAKYFASHQQSAMTGATSAVIWVLQGATGKIQFDTVRLDKQKEIMDVKVVSVATGEGVKENDEPKLSSPKRSSHGPQREDDSNGVRQQKIGEKTKKSCKVM